MPRIKLNKSLIDNSDWRLTYNKNKLQMLEYLNSKQSGGASLPLKSNVVVKRVKSSRTMGIITTLLMILLILISCFVVYGSYKKYVEKSSDYRDAGPITLLKQSFDDFRKFIYHIFGVIVGFFGIKKEEPVTIGPKNEVFNLGNNHYTYEEAEMACNTLGARLATRSEVEGAYNKGAEWCNYGWSAGGEALYPTQKKTYDLLKNAGREGECGVPGVNGGYFEDRSMKLGANCYGVKPSVNSDNIVNANCSNPKIVQKLDVTTGKYGISYTCEGDSSKSADLSTDSLMGNLMPFNNYTWSKNSRKSKLYVGNNTISRNGLRFEQFEGGAKHDDEIDEQNLMNAMADILEYLGGSSRSGEKKGTESLTEDLKGVLTPKKDRRGRDMWDRKSDEEKIVNVALNKIMSIYKSYGIPLDNKKIDHAIDNAAKHRHNIHKSKRDIDYILTRASINGIYQRYKINYGKE